MRLVIANRYMPVLNGLKLFWGMQTDPTLKGIPFVMINMDDNRETIDYAAKLGVAIIWLNHSMLKYLIQKPMNFLLQPVIEILSE